MNSEGANSFYLLVWKEQNTKRPFLGLLSSPLPGHLEPGESRKPARTPASSSLWAIHFSLDSIASFIKWVA